MILGISNCFALSVQSKGPVLRFKPDSFVLYCYIDTSKYNVMADDLNVSDLRPDL